ncbi:DUF6297 family protein [Streptomyces profundus]|uniref:DUF6297 family protein n=1 Tax=Streptomyces profundus TaxID=2867410 RepID=UPI001D1690AC|nr:DUF6297 family protein [Streptomyces sp. MA3_2.13]UED85379.1 DUF6297 family protein [Streptomyces sp. MA3_2.13]
MTTEHADHGGALAALDALRAPARRARRRQAAYTLYCVLLLTAIYAVPYVWALANAAVEERWRGPAAERLLVSLPTTGPALVALVLLGAAQLAVWRGPVRLSAPAVHWLLPHPVSRAALLLPRLRVGLLVTAVAATVLGGVVGLLVYAVGAGRPLPLVLAGAGGGLAVGTLVTTTSVLVQRDHPWHQRERLRPLLALVALAAGAYATLAAATGHVGPGRIALWSGPWGWPVLPLAAAGGRVTTAEGIAGAALAVLASGAALLVAHRAARAVPARVLRQQAAVADGFLAALWSLDARQAHAALRPTLRSRRASGPLATFLPRLPAPRARLLLLPWRDATGLLRAPRRLGLGLGLWALTIVCTASGQPLALVAALVTGYLAAAQLVEPARLESDDRRRAAQLPWPHGTLALWHAVLPAVLLWVTLPPALALCAASGLGDPALALLPLCVPALLGASLVSAYRGIMPGSMMLGVETPAGNSGPVQALLWQGRGPLLTLSALLPAQLADGPFALPAIWAVAVGVAALGWARHAARRRATG